MRLPVLLLLLFCLCEVNAQSSPSSDEDRGGLWDDFVEEYISDVERAEEEDLQLHLQELKELSEHPLNINTASVEDLLQLPFLSEVQIEQIHAYIYLHGQMQTLAELRLVPLIDETTRRRLSLFVYVEPERQTEERRNASLGIFAMISPRASTFRCTIGLANRKKQAAIVAMRSTIGCVIR